MSKTPELKKRSEMTLDEWLAGMLRGRSDDMFCYWSFPSDRTFAEYLDTIAKRSEDEVTRLVERMLVKTGSLGVDGRHLEWLLSSTGELRDQLLKRQYWKRLRASLGRSGSPPWEGITWVLDLLPHFPRHALEAIDAYTMAHAEVLPDGRLDGLSDASALIRAKFIGVPQSAKAAISFLEQQPSRTLECLTERLYDAMGYSTRLTTPAGDGGRDVIALRQDRGRKESIRIECKRHGRKVGVLAARALLGVVTDEKATKGALVATNGFTTGVRALASRNPRLELISGEDLILLLNEHLGPSWIARIDSLVSRSEQTNGETRVTQESAKTVMG